MDSENGQTFLAPENNEVKHFVLADYVVFGGMLAVSTFIGIYFGIKDKFQSSTREFLTAGGSLGILPVALSMLASFLSSITLIGQPAEAFLFGPQLWLFGVSSFFVIPVVGYVFAPFFQQRKYISAYEYFGERFSKKLQIVASLLFTIQMVLYLALVLYAPALAFHQVTGVNTILIVSVMYVVCIFYTTMGGMKAVVWTDTFQVVVLYAALFAVLIKGTSDIGGFSTVWNTNAKYHRTTLFNWDMNPTVRYTVWSTFIGSAFLHIAFYGGNQLQIQRYLSIKTPSQARKMLWVNTIGWTVVVLLTVYSGLLIFAYYTQCDPIKSGKVSTADELFPLYVMETLHQFPGFPGLFLAGVFSAGLSTVSTGINSLAAIWINEARGSKLSNEIWEKRSSVLVKLFSFGFGVLSFSLVFVVPYLGGLAPVAISLSGIFTGSLFGVFCLGIYLNFTNSIGAMSGLLSSTIALTWMATGSIVFSRPPNESYLRLNIPVTGCKNLTQPIPFVENRSMDYLEESFYLYRVSFLWYPALSCLLTIFIGAAVSGLVNLRRRNGINATGSESYNTTNRRTNEVPLNETDKSCLKPFVKRYEL